MKSLLERLDSAAGRWVKMIDSQLQEPVAQVITGQVFMQGAESNGHPAHRQPAQPVVRQTAAPEPKPTREAPIPAMQCAYE